MIGFSCFFLVFLENLWYNFTTLSYFPLFQKYTAEEGFQLVYKKAVSKQVLSTETGLSKPFFLYNMKEATR